MWITLPATPAENALIWTKRESTIDREMDQLHIYILQSLVSGTVGGAIGWRLKGRNNLSSGQVKGSVVQGNTYNLNLGNDALDRLKGGGPSLDSGAQD